MRLGKAASGVVGILVGRFASSGVALASTVSAYSV